MNSAASSGRLRILGLSEGDSQMSMSGVPGRLFDALGRRCVVVGRLDYGTVGVRRLALAAASIRTGHAASRARFHAGLRAHRALSSTLAGRLESGVAEFDLAVQVHGWVAGQPRPYAVYVDQTRLMAERGWPAWLPIERRERAEILRLEREMYLTAGHLFTMGKPARESLLNDYGVPPASVSVVGGGLMLESMPAPLELPSKPDILFVGRDFERKGLGFLLRAFALVRRELGDARLRIVGPRRAFHQPGVVNSGRIDRAQLVAMYRSSRVFCMPSRYEPWGLVFPEAMAYGMPCVGSTVQSIPDILDGGNAGLLVDLDDPVRLSEALLRLLTDDRLASRIGLAGRHRVQELYTWEHVAERMSAGLLCAVARSRPDGG